MVALLNERERFVWLYALPLPRRSKTTLLGALPSKTLPRPARSGGDGKTDLKRLHGYLYARYAGSNRRRWFSDNMRCSGSARYGRSDHGRTQIRRAGTSSLACLADVATINLTLGCAHACRYCYARGYSTYPGDGRVVLYSNTLDKLRQELARKRKRPQTVYFSPSCDLFQPVPQVLDSAISYSTICSAKASACHS